MIATLSWSDGLSVTALIAATVLVWVLVVSSSVWAVKRLLVCSLPRTVVVCLVVVAPVAMVGGGWCVYGLYRLRRPERPRSMAQRLVIWWIAASLAWLAAGALVEAVAAAIAAQSQPDQHWWVTTFELLPLVPAGVALITAAVCWIRGSRGALVWLRVAQAVFGAAFVLVGIAVPKPN